MRTSLGLVQASLRGLESSRITVEVVLKAGHRRMMQQSVKDLVVELPVEISGEEMVRDADHRDNMSELHLAGGCNSADQYSKHSPEQFIRNESHAGASQSDFNELLDGDRDGDGRSCISRRQGPASDSKTGLDGTKDMEDSGRASHENEMDRCQRNLSYQATPFPESYGSTKCRNSASRGQAKISQAREDCGPGSVLSQYPVPLSPLSGEAAQCIEYERALVAETAMKSGPAISKSAVLFEDDWLLVVDKPCGIYSEHVLATASSLLNATDLQARDSSESRHTLQHHLNSSATSVHLHLANRLDRDTSGVMVITKRKDAAGKLCNSFTKRQVQKSYVALCRGRRPPWATVMVNTGHGRSRFGAWRVYSNQDVGKGLPGGSVVREMTTKLLVVAVNKQIVHGESDFGEASPCKVNIREDHAITGDDADAQRGIMQLSPGVTMSTSGCNTTDKTDEVVIRATPFTGRTHQVRLHCQFVGLPLRGDVKYGGPHVIGGVKYEHHALHAESLSFKHPFTFEEMNFVAPLPRWATDAGVLPNVS